MFVAIVVLPTPPFGLKTTTIWARHGPQSSRWNGFGLHDRTAAVVDGVGHGGASPRSASGVTPPIRPGEVLVVERRLGDRRGQPVECPGRNDHEGRDRPSTFVEEGVVLERLPEIAFPVEDRDGDVRTRVEPGPPIWSGVSTEIDFEPGPVQLGDVTGPRWGAVGGVDWWRDGPLDGPTCWKKINPHDSGSRAVTLMTPSPVLVTRAWKPGRLGIMSRSDHVGAVSDREDELAVEAGETPTDWTPAARPRWRLKLAMDATLTRPTTTTWVVVEGPNSRAWRSGYRTPSGTGAEALREGILADVGDLFLLGDGAGGRFGLGGVEAGLTERLEARIGLRRRAPRTSTSSVAKASDAMMSRGRSGSGARIVAEEHLADAQESRAVAGRGPAGVEGRGARSWQASRLTRPCVGRMPKRPQ